MISLRRIPLLLLAVLLTTGVVFSQTQITSGVIQGTVLDPSGAVIPGASVEAHNLDTQIRQATASDESVAAVGRRPTLWSSAPRQRLMQNDGLR